MALKRLPIICIDLKGSGERGLVKRRCIEGGVQEGVQTPSRDWKIFFSRVDQHREGPQRLTVAGVQISEHKETAETSSKR